MKMHLLVYVSFLFFSFSLKAQTLYEWTFASKKIADKTFEIHCAVSVNEPWHIYSQFTPDGGPVPTSSACRR